MQNQQNIKAAARRLWLANQNKTTCEPIRDLIGEMDLESAYAIQQINNELRKKNGAVQVGCKIGLTSKVVQKQLGVDQPDFGLLFDEMEVLNGDTISINQLMQPKVEAEIAFVLGKDLNKKNISTIDVLSAVEYALVSIEVVGSRIKNWDIKIADTIADNASASHFVLGHKPVKLSDLDLLNCQMSLSKNGIEVSKGIGKACLGSPVNACIWLAQKMVDLNQPLKAGDIILTGALGPMVSVEAGDKINVQIEGLGEAELTIEI